MVAVSARLRALGGDWWTGVLRPLPRQEEGRSEARRNRRERGREQAQADRQGGVGQARRQVAVTVLRETLSARCGGEGDGRARLCVLSW